MKKFNAVIFDLDSTLVKIEGLDWLAEKSGKAKLVERLTSKSMNGEISVEEAMQKKMALIAPSYEDLILLGNKYIESIVADAKQVIEILIKLNKQVWIVTGNFQPAVSILAKELGIPEDRVISNEIYFDELGKYKGFNINHPLSKNGGKAKVLKKVIKKSLKVVFIGDSISDLETASSVDLFIGFGGVKVRKAVKDNSKIFIKSKSLYPILNQVLDANELRYL